MEENLGLDVLPKDPDRLMESLAGKNMAVARSKNDFLYILEQDGEFLLFSHTPGSPGGGRKQFPKDEKYTAMIRNLAHLADALFQVEFDESFNIYSVMASAEEGILSMFPGENRDEDADIEFIIPEKE